MDKLNPVCKCGRSLSIDQIGQPGYQIFVDAIDTYSFEVLTSDPFRLFGIQPRADVENRLAQALIFRCEVCEDEATHLVMQFSPDGWAMRNYPDDEVSE